MSLSIEIQKKPNCEREIRKVNNPKEVFELKEVQEIKNAVQEHLLFIGLDSKNAIKNISLIGIGTSKSISIDSKYIIRTALITASDKVILVHNHPSNGLSPSSADRHLTNVTNKVLEAFNVQFVDHIIVAENDFASMGQNNDIDRNYEDSRTNLIDNTFLLEENKMLKQEVRKLKNSIEEGKKEIESEEEIE